MSPTALRRAAVLCVALTALLCGAADAARVEVDSLVLEADGGFTPRTLPRRQFAPIEFKGHFNVSARDGGKPVALNQAIVEFDRDGRLSVGGLPTCPPERVAALGTGEAREACAGAIVGSGRIEALISVAGGAVPASSPLTIFNGPPVAGHPSVVLHARTTTPGTQTFAIVVPIERIRGEFGYRVVLDVPPIAAGLGAITHVDVKLGRRFSAGGKRRSYVSAHCSDGILRTRGRFTFADGTVIDGSVEKFCRAQ